MRRSFSRANLALQAEIDERARAEQDRNRFFDMSVEMLCIAGFDGYFKQLNQAWERTLGFSLEELKARPFIETSSIPRTSKGLRRSSSACA